MNFKKYHVSKNLFDKTADYATGTTTYNYTINGLDPNKYYTCSTNFERISGVTTASLYFNGGDSINNGVWSGTPRTFRPNSNGEITVYIRYKESASAPPIIDDVIAGTIWVMVNEGSTPQPYEPYSSEVWHDIPHYIMGTSTDTLTTLPAVIYANDTTATVGLKGNMSQSSTPSPQTPIQPQECGERTGNLIEFKNGTSTVLNVDITINSGIITVNGTANGSGGRLTRISEIVTLEAGTYTISQYGDTMVFYLQNADNTSQYFTGTFTINDTTRFYVSLGFTNGNQYDKSFKFMLNTGSTALPYEPWGVKIPILSGGTTTNVYLGEVQSTRNIYKWVFTGNENWTLYGTGSNRYFASTAPYACIGATRDYLITSHFEASRTVLFVTNGTILRIYDANSDWADETSFKSYLQQQYAAGTPVCVWYVLATSTTGITNEPLRKIGNYADEVSGITIPTIAGANTISIGTTLQPSEVSVNYHGWHPAQSVHEAGRTVNIYDKYNTIDIPDFGVRYGVYCELGNYSIYNDTDNNVYWFSNNGSARFQACSPHSTSTVSMVGANPAGFYMPYNDGSLGEVTIVQGSTVPDHYIPYIDWD